MLILLAIIVIAGYALWRRSHRSTFVSGEAIKVHAVTLPLFEKTGADTKYSAFKMAVDPVYPKSDVALFADTKKTYLSGEYTAEKIQELM